MIEPITFLTKPKKIHCRLRFSRKYELRSFDFLSIRLTVDGTATLITCSHESLERFSSLQGNRYCLHFVFELIIKTILKAR